MRKWLRAPQSRFLSSLSNPSFAISIFGIGIANAALNTVFSLFASNALVLDPSKLAILLFVLNFSGMIASLIMPSLSDRRLDGKTTLMVALLLGLFGYVGLALSVDFVSAALVTAFFIGPAGSVVGLFFAHARTVLGPGPIIVQLRGVFSAAWIAGPIFGALLAEMIGYRPFFWVLAVFMLPLMLIVSAMPRRTAGLIQTDDAKPELGMLIISFSGMVLLQGAAAASITIAPLILVNELGQPLSWAGILLGFSAGLEVLFLLVLAKTLSNYDERSLITIGCVSGIVYFLFLFFAKSYALLFLGQIFNAFFVICLKAIGMSWFQGLIPSRPGLSTGLYVNTSKLGALLAAPLVGAAALSLGSYQGASVVPIGLTTFGAVLVYATRWIGSIKP